MKKSRKCPERINKSTRHSTSSCQSNISTPQGSPLPVQSPLYPNQSPMHHNQSPRNNNPPALSPACPAHFYSTQQLSSQHIQQDLIPNVIGENFLSTINALNVSDSLPEGDTVSIQDSSAIWDTPATYPEMQGNPPSEKLENFEGVNLLEGGVSFDQSFIPSRPNIMHTQEETQTTATSSNPLLSPEKMELRALSRLLTPDKFELLLSWLPHDQGAMEIDVQTVPVTESTNVPVCTSSSSSGETLGYRYAYKLMITIRG